MNRMELTQLAKVFAPNRRYKKIEADTIGGTGKATAGKMYFLPGA